MEESPSKIEEETSLDESSLNTIKIKSKFRNNKKGKKTSSNKNQIKNS
jgi:hypothetical protein